MRSHRKSSLLLASAMACCTACSPAPGPLTLDVVVGQETDTFSASPAVARMLVRCEAPPGTVVAQTETNPGGGFDLGTLPNNVALTFATEGLDEDDQVVVRGQTLSVVPAALQQSELRVFAQRIDRFARPLGQLPEALGKTTLMSMGPRYLLVMTANSDRSPELWFYDLITYRFDGPVTLVHPALSVAHDASEQRVLLIGNDAAHWLDLSGATQTPVALPSGLSAWSDIAGGLTTPTEGQGQYIVGATRASAPSDAVLHIAPDGTLTVSTLQAQRHGAAAGWSAADGLLVVGGNGDAPAVERLPAGNTNFTAADHAPDSTKGAALIRNADDSAWLLLGGDQQGMPPPARQFDATCVKDCTLQTVQGGNGQTTAAAVAHPFSDGRVLVVGERLTETGAFLWDPEGAPRDVVLRESRRFAGQARGPLGHLFIAGGQPTTNGVATSIERFWID